MTGHSARSVDELGDEIATLAAHIQAAMARWLALVAEFDDREGWAESGFKSCAAWLSWRCSIDPTTAREHVRIARRLGELPLAAAAFARGELSYSKVRALTRVEDVEREEELVELARTATAAQLVQIVRGYRRVVAAEDAQRIHESRYLQLSHDDDGSMLLRGRLTPEEGALLRRALDAARDELIAGQPPADEVDVSVDDADALSVLAESAMAHGLGVRSGGDRYQVVVHVEPGALRDGEATGARCELDDGAPLASRTAQRVCCDASLVTLVERDGTPLSVGRKTRAIPPAMQRALRSRDRGCRFPGCGQRHRVDAHHIVHWAHGGETKLPNLVQLCRHHHRLVHEGGYGVELRRDRLLFRRPDGRAIPAVPRPRRGEAGHVIEITRERGTRISATTCGSLWNGEPLDLPAAVDAMLHFAPLRL